MNYIFSDNTLNIFFLKQNLAFCISYCLGTCIMLWHGTIGIKVVIDDYVHSSYLRMMLYIAIYSIFIFIIFINYVLFLRVIL